MASDEFKFLANRTGILKKRFFPPLNPTAQYTTAQEDSMRALRMLFHAEVEHYLEKMSKKLAADLEREVNGLNNSSSVKQWAIKSAKEALVAGNSNNGIKDSDIKQMFSPLGFTDADFENINPSFLSTMKTFGKRRGDVAHQSVMNVTYSITRQTDEKMIDEIMQFLRLFDKLLEKRRLYGFFNI